MLAHDLCAESTSNIELAAPPEADLDVTDERVLRAVMAEVRPNIVINAAAYTNVDGAESEPDLAYSVNSTALGNIGREAMTVGASVVHYSTDYVYGGSDQRPYRETDPTSPLGVYGASKLAGEAELARTGASHLIIRTQWLFGLRGRSFPRTMWQRAIEGKATRVVNDQVGCPTYTVDLARATWRLIEIERQRISTGDNPVLSGRSNRFPLLHIANSGTATWYSVAKRVFEAADAASLLSSCTTLEYPTPARRPAWSVLDTAKYEGIAGAPLPSWEDAIDRFLDHLRAEE